MADTICLHFPKTHSQGNSPMFPPEGEVALMFLKPYTGLSDDELIEMLNDSIHMQMFCGVLIDPVRPIKNGKIVSIDRPYIRPIGRGKENKRVEFGAKANNENRWYCTEHGITTCFVRKDPKPKDEDTNLSTA